MIMLTTPVIASAIPKRSKGSPPTHDVPPPDFALRVHTESNVWELLMTQRPTAIVATERINVMVLFITLFYHHKSFH
jgi:hypothetical protein